MPTFDDLPAGAALPPLDDAAAAAMQGVQDSGRTLLLGHVDEAELVAVGLGAAQRAGRPTLTEAELAAAADRLVGRGLAEPAPWAAGRVRPAGGLLLHAQLTTHPRARTGLTQSWATTAQGPAQPGAALARRRITVLIDVAHAGLACVETSSLPGVGAPASVPVVLELARLDVLVAQVAAEAFAGAPRETVVAFADGTGTLVPSRVRVDAGGHGELESSRHGLLGARTVRAAVDADAFADHLRDRLMAAG